MPMPPKEQDDKAVKTSCTLYPDELKALAAKARERRISRSQLLREIVQEWIRKEEEKK